MTEYQENHLRDAVAYMRHMCDLIERDLNRNAHPGALAAAANVSRGLCNGLNNAMTHVEAAVKHQEYVDASKDATPCDP